MLKIIEHLHHYDDFYDFYEYCDDFYEYYDDFFLIEHLHHQKTFISFFCIYKMYLISSEGYKNASFHFFKIKKTDEI